MDVLQILLLPIIILLLFNTIFTVQQQTFKVVERFGKYKRIARPGITVSYTHLTLPTTPYV